VAWHQRRETQNLNAYAGEMPRHCALQQHLILHLAWLLLQLVVCYAVQETAPYSTLSLTFKKR